MSVLSTWKTTTLRMLAALAAFCCISGGGIATAAQVVLAWDANADQAITGYRIYYRTGAAGPPYEGQGLTEGTSPIEVPMNALTDSQNPQYALSGLSEGTYYFVCTAYDGDGNESGYSNEVSLTVGPDDVPPVTPVDVVARALDANRVLLSWSPSSDAGGSGLAGYRIYRDGQWVGTTDEAIFLDSGLLGATSYAYSIEAFDLADNVSTQRAVVSVSTAMESDFSVRVNCGGEIYLDMAGHQWLADAGFDGGKTSSTADPIARTEDDALFQSARWDSNPTGHLLYSFEVPNGDYQVNLYFADLYDGTAGAGLRVFDTYIEGQRVLDDLDIFSRVGHDAALILSFDTRVSDGTLEIDLVDQVENAKIAAIEFFQKGVSASAPKTYTVTASSGVNGRISPAGPTTIDAGGSLTYTIEPFAHHHVAGVYVDDEPIGAATTYRFDNLSSDHTIRAEFAVDTYTVVADAGSDGTISPSGAQTVAHGDTLSFQITPNPHREIADVVVNGTSMGPVANYTLSNINQNTTITTSFIHDTHGVDASAEGNGTITPAGETRVPCGQSLAYTITPEPHHHISDVKVDGVSVGAVSTYIFDHLTQDRTITASFAADEYAVTASAGDHGSITPAGVVTASYGSDIHFTIQPDAGYEIEEVHIDGKSVGTAAKATIDHIQSDHSITVVFAPQAVNAPVFESGEVVVNHEWTRVDFRNVYLEPIVVARSLSINGGDPAVVRVRNIDPSGCEVRVQEWDYRDGYHVAESVGYMVMERGAYTLADGTRLEASTFDTDRTDGYDAVLFERVFNHTPVVITAVISTNESDAVTGRLRNIDTQGFQFGLREQEGNEQCHTNESIAYIAWEPAVGLIDGHVYMVGRTGNAVTHDFSRIGFSAQFQMTPVFLADMQTADGGDTANVRWRQKTNGSVEVQIDEEQSRDEEINHTSEVVGYMVFDKAPVNSDRDNDGLSNADETDIYGSNPDVADTDSDGLDDAAELAYWQERWNMDFDGDGLLPLQDADADGDGVEDGIELEQGSDPADAASVFTTPTFEHGEASINHEWTRIAFAKHYSCPIVIAGPASINGSASAVVRIRNVDADGFDIRIQEWDYYDDVHKYETVGYLVMEGGAYTLLDGTRIEAGSFSSDNIDSFDPVTFGGHFNVMPVVMTSIVSNNAPNAVAGRMHSIDHQGFMYGMQEQEANNQAHAAESIAYIAWEPGTGEIDGVHYQIERTGDTVTHRFQQIDFLGAASTAPTLLADMQTADGGDPANLRWRNKTLSSVEIQVDEEQSWTDETNHTTEVVGYMIFGN